MKLKERIVVFGLGKMGLPLAAIFASKGFKVTGVDLSDTVVSSINNGICTVSGEPGLSEIVKTAVNEGNLSATVDGAKAVQSADVVIILVPTLIDSNNKPVMTPVEKVMRLITSNMKKGAIIVTECTMPPGSTDSFLSILEEKGMKCGVDFSLAHCPERTMSGTAIRDITGQYVKIIGASDEKAANTLKAMYEKINTKGVLLVSSVKAAEAVKVFEGVYRDVNLALANELSLVSKRLNINAIEVINAANTQPYSHIHTPGCGVGGHCIPVYPYFLIDKDTPLMKTAREVNDLMPIKLAEMVDASLAKAKVGKAKRTVMVFGLTYRGGVREFFKTPAAPFIENLQKKGYKVYAYDPVCTQDDAKRFNVELDNSLSKISEVDCIAITADHKEFKTLNWKVIASKMKNKVLVDGKYLLDSSEMSSIFTVYARLTSNF